MNPYDIFVLAIVLIFATWGWHRGFLLMIGALVIALISATIAGHFATLIAGDPTEIGGSWFYNIIFFTIFITSSIAGNIALKFLDIFTDIPLVESWKNWGGLILGTILGLFIAGITSMVLTRFPLWEKLDESTSNSKTAEFSTKFALITVPFWPAELRNAYSLIEDNLTLEEQKAIEEEAIKEQTKEKTTQTTPR